MRLKWSWNRSWVDKHSKPQTDSAKTVGAMCHERFLECSVVGADDPVELIQSLSG